jgi:hypothetical protein
VQHEEGRFVSPGLWVDSWVVHADSPVEVPVDEPREDPGEDPVFRFTHAVTPVDATSTWHVWRVSRNFAPDGQSSEQLLPRFTGYYRAVQDILETMQDVLSADGPRPDVSVAADAAALQVRKIVARMVADERRT